MLKNRIYYQVGTEFFVDFLIPRKGESETTEKNGTVNDPKTETGTLPRTGTRTKNNNNNNNNSHRHRLTRSATRRKTKRERKGRMVTRKRQGKPKKREDGRGGRERKLRRCVDHYFILSLEFAKNWLTLRLSHLSIEFDDDLHRILGNH